MWAWQVVLEGATVGARAHALCLTGVVQVGVDAAAQTAAGLNEEAVVAGVIGDAMPRMGVKNNKISQLRWRR